MTQQYGVRYQTVLLERQDVLLEIEVVCVCEPCVCIWSDDM